MMARVRLFLEMIRFSHTLFALPFALLAALMAWRADPHLQFEPRLLVGILICMLAARSAAMAFNRLVDRHLDARNPRTAGRHLPSGSLTVRQVWAFWLLSAAAFAGGTLLFWPNPWPIRLALPVLAFLCGYSYAKRFTSLAHFWLGAALMLSPVAAWLALRGEVAWPPLILGGAVLFWVAGFDIIYACQDQAVDRQLGLRSLPARLGIKGALRLAAGCHVVTVVFLATLPSVYAAFGVVYYLTVAAIGGLLVFEHALVRPDDLSRVNLAFFHVNWLIGVALLSAGSLDLFV